MFCHNKKPPAERKGSPTCTNVLHSIVNGRIILNVFIIVSEQSKYTTNFSVPQFFGLKYCLSDRTPLSFRSINSWIKSRVPVDD